jgi:release factor glutamine methyltransferase
MNVKEYLEQLNYRPDARDAQILLAHVIGRPRTWLLAHMETPLTPPQLAAAKEAFSQFQAGVPLPYILGHWEFFGLDLEVTKDVLIPRPETELLVEKAIVWLQSSPQKKLVADIGTGSGAIAVALAVHVPDIHILATDISPAALEVAKRNAKKFNVENRIDFIECDLFPDHGPQTADHLQSSTVHGLRSFDLFCANLPYVPTETMRGLAIYGREPTVALDGGTDGLVLYRRLFILASDRLAPDAKMLIEIEASLGAQSLNLARDSFPQATIHLHQDLSGRDRLLEIIFP